MSSNVKFLLATEPLFGIPVNWTRTYASLFMAALGMSGTQIGAVASLTMVTQMLVAPLGGYVADRFGRKKILITFDTIAWIIPTFLWMIAQNPWYFVAAAILNGMSMIIGPSWNCLLVEDTAPHRRATVFAALQLVLLGAGLFSPVAGWIVQGYSVVMGARIIYGLTLISVTIMVIARHYRVTETSVGRSRIQEMRNSKFSDVFANYREIFAMGVKNRNLVYLFFLYTINFAYNTLWHTYSALYMTAERGLQLTPAVVSIWPTFSSLVMILALLLIVPKVKPEKLPQWLILSSSLLCGGMGIFILSPAQSYPVLAVAAVLIACGMALINPVRDTFIANVIDDRARAVLLSGMNSLSMLLIIPITPLAGWLFEINPRFPILVLLIMLAIAVTLSIRLAITAKEAINQNEEGVK
ncbi:MAG: MFS transporter [Firmicutes bacterium]|nr:MFS transporter [Bacillota bacterium]